MKTKNVLLAFFCLLMMGGAYAQPFEMGFHGTYGPGPFFPLYPTDMTHYSIESTPGGDYVCAGTVSVSGGRTDIHLFKLDVNGTLLWELYIDYAGMNDAALDVMVDPSDDIVLTGYVESGLDTPEMYVAKFSSAGVFINDAIIGGFPTASSAGTNIIYSSSTGNYIVGGLHHDPPVPQPLVDGQAVLVELNPTTLLPINGLNLSLTGSIADLNSSINDIVEVPGMGYFATGSYEVPAPPSNMGVLAVFVDLGFATINDFSHHDGSGTGQRGVSAVYEPSMDRITMLSNHDATGNPKITSITGVSGGGALTTQFDLVLFDMSGTVIEGSAFKIMNTPWNPASLCLAGRFKFGPFGTGFDNNVWLLELDKPGYGYIAGMLWNVTSAHYALLPTPVNNNFSTYIGRHPYIFNEEIITNRIDMAGLVVLAPTDVTIGGSPNYGLDVVTTNTMTPLGCYEPIASSIINVTPIMEPLVFTLAIPSGTNPILPAPPRVTGQDWICLDPSLPRAPIAVDNGDLEAGPHNLASLGEETGVSLTVLPNPSEDIFTINLEGSGIKGRFTIVNTMGQIVYTSSEITSSNFTEIVDLSEFESGIYILQFNSADQLITEKLIKQ